MPESKRFLLRLNPDLFEALRRWANDDLRSINGQIEFLLTDQARRAGRLASRPRRAANALEPAAGDDGDLSGDDEDLGGGEDEDLGGDDGPSDPVGCEKRPHMGPFLTPNDDNDPDDPFGQLAFEQDSSR